MPTEPHNDPASTCIATSYLTCPYSRGVPGGRCLNGCRDEPWCQNGEPEDGWQPVNAAGEPVTLTDEQIDQIAISRWDDSIYRRNQAEMAANTCTPAELAAIRRETEADERESERLEAEQAARVITDNDPPF